MTRRTLLFATAPAIVRAQTIQDKGRKLILDAIQALGGEKFMGMRDRVEVGRAYSYYRERLSGLSVARLETQYSDLATGLKQRERQQFGKDKDYSVVYTGDGKGWDITYRGAKQIEEDVVKNWEENLLRNPMYILRCRADEKGMIFERRGQEVFENQPVEIVDVTDADNREVALYIHASTKLLIRGYSKRQNQKDRGWDDQDTRYAKYRLTNGVMWPWAITRSRNGERNFELYSNEVLINSGLPSSNFDINADTKIIPTKKR